MWSATQPPSAIAGAQKVMPGLPAALRRVEEHALPLESGRAQAE